MISFWSMEEDRKRMCYDKLDFRYVWLVTMMKKLAKVEAPFQNLNH